MQDRDKQSGGTGVRGWMGTGFDTGAIYIYISTLISRLLFSALIFVLHFSLPKIFPRKFFSPGFSVFGDLNG